MKIFDGERQGIEHTFLDRVSSGSLNGVRSIWDTCQAKLDIDCRNSSGETALIIAARRNDLPMFSFLLDCGADLSLTEPVRNRTAQFYAQKHGDREILTLIEDHISNCTASVSDSDSLSGRAS